MKDLVRMQFGSHVYGTSTPASDQDVKGVFLPDARDILMQKAPGVYVHTTKADKHAKNGPDDVDTELYALHRYIQLLLEGQTVAVDMLFTPQKHYIGPVSFWWSEIQANRHKFLHKGVSSFVGYCRTQANKYGIKGSRIAAARAAINWLNNFDESKKLLDIHWDGLAFGDQWHTHLISIKNPRGVEEPYLNVCNRKIPLHLSVKHAKSLLQLILNGYGERALQAERNEGVDWKALGHAVRICNQAIELLATGNIIFPRPEAATLLQVRRGELPYKAVAEMIEQGMDALAEAQEHSFLPEVPDTAYAEKLICSAYEYAILRS